VTTASATALVPRLSTAAEARAVTSGSDEKYDRSRHWRNARTHANHDSHDPAEWKYRPAGNYLLNSVARRTTDRPDDDNLRRR
jgi:hypothetical protein